MGLEVPVEERLPHGSPHTDTRSQLAVGGKDVGMGYEEGQKVLEKEGSSGEQLAACVASFCS